MTGARMTGWVGDYSAARPGGAALKAAGAAGAVRYAGALVTEFNLTRAEADDLTASGVPIGIVVEQQADFLLRGHLAGNQAALAAMQDTRAAGLPDGVLYFAGDTDLTLGGPTHPGSPGDVQMGKVADTLAGAAGILGWDKIGFYGSFYAIDWLVAKAVPVAAYWQTTAWSDGKVHPRAVLLQRALAPAGIPPGVDYNDVLGDWKPRTTKPKPTPTPKPTPGGGMNAHDIQQALVNIGWPLVVDGNIGPTTKQAILDFQTAWNGSAWLAVDGVAGPATQEALFLSVWTGGLLSPHFRGREMACKHCGWIKTHRVLLAALERIRPPGGLSITSGYRCVQHNRDIGGAENSQHIYGTAADIPPIYTSDQIIGLRLFSGIERRSDGRVYHVDVRHAGPSPGGWTVSNPSVFNWG